MPFKLNHPPSLADMRAKRVPVPNANTDHDASLRPLDRLALAITNRVGTMGFFLLIFSWTVLWLGWNLLAPPNLQFDPPMAFVLWLFISNMIQIFLMPLLMVGQNLQSRHAEIRAQNDYQVNVRSEHEIDTVLQHLEYQNQLLHRLLEQAGIPIEPEKPNLSVQPKTEKS